MKCKRLIVLVCLLLGVAAGILAAHWTVNPRAWKYDMTAYVKLEVNGVALTDYSDYEIAAFCGAECRGVVKPHTASDGTVYGYLRIRSNVASGETITLRVYQVSADSETLLSETIAFEAQTMTGTPGEPIVLTLGIPIFGDLNGDQLVDVSDVTRLINIAVSGVYDAKYDLNNDQKVDVSDVTKLINIAVGNNNAK